MTFIFLIILKVCVVLIVHLIYTGLFSIFVSSNLESGLNDHPLDIVASPLGYHHPSFSMYRLSSRISKWFTGSVASHQVISSFSQSPFYPQLHVMFSMTRAKTNKRKIKLTNCINNTALIRFQYISLFFYINPSNHIIQST